MSGDWIKMRGNLWDDPRVSALVDATDSSEAAVVGALYWLWATADQHTEDGTLPGLTIRQVDRKTGIAGFGQAVADVGWIEVIEGGIRITRFDEHNGASAKKRCQTAKRVAKFKSSVDPVTQETGTGNAVSVSGALPRDRDREEIEKEQEQEPKAGRASAPVLPEWLGPDVWKDWHDYRSRTKNWTTRARALSLNTLTALHAQGQDPRAVVDQAIERGWTKLFPVKPDHQPRAGPNGTPSKHGDFGNRDYGTGGLM